MAKAPSQLESNIRSYFRELVDPIVHLYSLTNMEPIYNFYRGGMQSPEQWIVPGAVDDIPTGYAELVAAFNERLRTRTLTREFLLEHVKKAHELAGRRFIPDRKFLI